MSDDYKLKKCPRVALRMECPECGYPFSEAIYVLDERIPHLEPARPMYAYKRGAA